MKFSAEMKQKTVAALMERREFFDGNDAQFAYQFGMSGSIYSRIKSGKWEGMIRDGQWLNIARELDVALTDRKWNAARTDVFAMIEEDVMFCKKHSKSMVLVDDCGIGKTFTAKYLSRTVKNCFYIDGRQATGKHEFVKLLAKTIGIDTRGTIANMRENIKYALKVLPQPIVIVDEAGACEDAVINLLLEIWNATENMCGWYLMGADGLRARMERNIGFNRVGWAELFSRFNDRYNSIVPKTKDERIGFYKKMIGDVLAANMEDTSQINEIIRRCLSNDSGRISGLRRAETIVRLMQEEQQEQQA